MKIEIHKTIYSCDCCKKEVKSKEDLCKCVIPMRYCDEYGIPHELTNGDIELCEDCWKKLNDVIRKYFHAFGHNCDFLFTEAYGGYCGHCIINNEPNKCKSCKFKNSKSIKDWLRKEN